MDRKTLIVLLLWLGLGGYWLHSTGRLPEFGGGLGVLPAPDRSGTLDIEIRPADTARDTARKVAAMRMLAIATACRRTAEGIEESEYETSDEWAESWGQSLIEELKDQSAPFDMRMTFAIDPDPKVTPAPRPEMPPTYETDNDWKTEGSANLRPFLMELGTEFEDAAQEMLR